MKREITFSLRTVTVAIMVATYTPAVKGLMGTASPLVRVALTVSPTCVRPLNRQQLSRPLLSDGK